ncbi:MAG: helix-turn-helix transcriptional regulator [Gordonibacter sp.]
MFDQNKGSKLSGAASWLAILGAAFYWVWLDRGMFDDALLSSSQQGAVEAATVILMVSSVLSFVAVYAVVARRGRWTSWPLRAMVVVSWVGLLGGLLCLVFRGEGGVIPFCLGGALLGFAMGCQNVVWGTVAVSQGVEKTVLHISGAWGLSLFLNLLMIPLPKCAEGVAVMMLPLLSLVCYGALYRLQARARFAIEFKEGTGDVVTQGHQAFGIDVQFLVVILVFCGAFGFVSWFAPANLSPSGSQDAAYLALARCAVALGFFIVCYAFSMKRVELLLRVALSLVAAGVVVLTIGVFVSSMNDPGRILVAMGYSGFDILVWTLISYYVRTSKKCAAQVIAVVMAAEQIGISLGIGSGMAIDHVEIGAFEASIFLAAMNYLLLLACFALLRRYDRQSILLGDSPADSSLSGDANAAVDLFAKNARLTVREKEIAFLLAEGRNVPFISKKLFVSENTVKSHVRHIYEKSGVHNRQELLDELEVIRGA